jgi:hypothetical protein
MHPNRKQFIQLIAKKQNAKQNASEENSHHLFNF